MRNIFKEPMTEKEMRETKPKRCETSRELKKFIDSLVEREHDYGTCVYAMSMGAEAAFRYVAGKLGVTGFQASCADLDFIKRIRHFKGPFTIRDYDLMLYPQYEYKFEKTVSKETADWLKDEAYKKLSENPNSHPDVKAHWKKIASGELPFGYIIKDEK